MAVGSLLQSLSRCCRVPFVSSLRAGCCVRYMARHVVAHTMQSFHPWRIPDGQCSLECGHWWVLQCEHQSGAPVGSACSRSLDKGVLLVGYLQLLLGVLLSHWWGKLSRLDQSTFSEFSPFKSPII